MNQYLDKSTDVVETEEQYQYLLKKTPTHNASRAITDLENK